MRVSMSAMGSVIDMEETPWNLGLSERHAEAAQELAPLLVGRRRGHESDVHPVDLRHLVVVDLREDDLLGQPERVVAAPVEGARAHAAEVADARDGDRDEPVEELPHPRAA